MKISEEKYKYLYMVDYLKKRLKRWEQTEIAKKMNMDSQAISWILNGSRITNIDKIKEIAQAIWLNSIEIEKLEKEASKKAFENRFWESLIPDWDLNLLEKIDFDNDWLLKVAFKREFWKELTEHDLNEVKKFMKFTANG